MGRKERKQRRLAHKFAKKAEPSRDQMVAMDEYLRNLHVTWAPVRMEIPMPTMIRYRPFMHGVMVPDAMQIMKSPELDPADWAALFHDELLRAMPVTPWET